MARVLTRRSKRTGIVQYGRFNSMFLLHDPFSHHFDFFFEKRNAATFDMLPEHLVWKINENEHPDSEWIYQEEEI